MDGWVEEKADFRIAYSNQKVEKNCAFSKCIFVNAKTAIKWYCYSYHLMFFMANFQIRLFNKSDVCYEIYIQR